MKNKKIFIILLFVAVLAFANLTFFISFASAQVSTPEPVWKGIVPCGRNSGTAEEMAPCTLCHLVIGFQRLVQYGLYMAVTLALVAIFFSGVMYIISSGDEGMMTSAKGFLKASLIGFAVVLGGWLIVNVTLWVLGAKGDLGIGVESWNKFTCSTTSLAVTEAIKESSLAPAPTATPTNPIISLSPSSLTFSDTGVGSVSDPQKIIVTNIGGGSLKIELVQFAGINSLDFAQTNTCGSELAKDATCTVSITFKPTALDSKSATINIASNATEKTKTANLSGTARNKQCELLAGSKNADFIFMLMRSQFGAPDNTIKISDCTNSKNWDNASQTDLNEFKTITSEMANGLKQVRSADQPYFAVYRMDEVYDGTNGNKLLEIIQKDCPEAAKNKLFSYGYIYNGGCELAFSRSTTRNAYYCEKDDKYRDKSFAHEQVGHAFAKLKDEYLTKNCDILPWSNITKDSGCAKWKSIASSPNCYKECSCSKGACFRSTVNSIMRHHYLSDGIFSPLQDYIISACVKKFTDCPPSSLIEQSK